MTVGLLKPRWSIIRIVASVVGLIAALDILVLFGPFFLGAVDQGPDRPLLPSADPIASLNRRLSDGELRLTFDRTRGFLAPVLRLLDIPVASQTLVYAKTSRQRELIGPATPRAIYFNDWAAVGWVPGGDALEVTILDARGFIGFFTFDQRPDGPQQFRAGTRCFECHSLPDTGGVQGLLVSSLQVDGGAERRERARPVDHRTPWEDRWDGWYVTSPPWSSGRDRRDPSGRMEPAPYPSSRSDIVALLVLDHQVHMTNLIVRLAREGRLPNPRGGGRTADDARRTADLVREFVDYLLFVDEAPFPARVRGAGGFVEAFAATRPSDPRGRSLRALDLDRRLLRYPCSYMIYTAAFDGLPRALKHAVYRRLSEILTGHERSRRYGHLSPDDRQAIVEILRATKSDLPGDFARTDAR